MRFGQRVVVLASKPTALSLGWRDAMGATDPAKAAAGSIRR